MTSFILVPGALHVAAHLERLAELLREGGKNEAVVVELPILGDNQVSSETLPAAFQLHVAVILAAVDAASKPVVLLGHCLAGWLITCVAEHRSTVVQRLVFVAAETLPGPLSFSLEPAAEWAGDGLLALEAGETGIVHMVIAEGKTSRLSEVLFSDAEEVDRQAAGRLLRPSPVYDQEYVDGLQLREYWGIPKAYIHCTRDKAMLPVHQELMFTRLGACALKFELDSGHGPFISCPDQLAATVLKIPALPVSAFALRQICEKAWQPPNDRGIRIELLWRPGETTVEASEKQSAVETGVETPLPKRPHVRLPTPLKSQVAAYRISKSRRDSTLVKVLKFPAGLVAGCPVEYWYESYVDDPAQYTNSSLNVPERGHEPPLDVAGMSRSLCARGTVVSSECSRVAFSWERVVTKVPGEAWVQANDLKQLWGIDGREWNGSYMNSETGDIMENLSKYAKGDPDAFWEDVPRKAKDLLANIENN